MTEEQIALGRRAVACRGWRWMPGMRYQLHPTHPWFRYDGEDCSDDDGNPLPQAPPNLQSRNAIPDLADPATLGCLLALVREAYPLNRRDLYPRVYPSSKKYPRCRWTIYAYAKYSFPDYPKNLVISANSEAEVLVAALEAAP